MCQLLKVSKSNYYKSKKPRSINDQLAKFVTQIFNANRKVYGSRKIKVELQKLGYQVSRNRISQIMLQ